MKGIDRETCRVRARARSDRYGEMKEVKVAVQESEKRSATFNWQSLQYCDHGDVVFFVKYLSNSPYILSPVSLAETQVLV